MASTPKYGIARALLDLTAGVGAVAVILGGIAGIVGYNLGHSLYHYAASVILVLNGFVAIAGSQMGAATLDTAIATREMAEGISKLVDREIAQKPRPEATPSIRATR